MVGRLIRNVRLDRLRRRGLQIGPDSIVGAWSGWPDWGSEPYLISIGKHVAISGGVVFITHDGGTWVFRDDPGFKGLIKYGRITIHDNCMIGHRAVLLPGVEVGPNSVIAAGAVVTRSVPPNSVAMGSPARVIMSRDDYAKQSLATAPIYDRAAYKRDKRSELLRLFPRPW